MLLSKYKNETLEFVNFDKAEFSNEAKNALNQVMNEFENFSFLINNGMIKNMSIINVWIKPIISFIELKIKVDSKLSGVDMSNDIGLYFPECTSLILNFKNN